MKFISYLQEMNLTINFSDIENGDSESQDEIIQIIQDALKQNGYTSKIEETKTSWKKINHLATLRINKEK
jgi:ferritin